MPDFFGRQCQGQRDAAFLSRASRAFAHELMLNPLEDTSPRGKRRRRYPLPAQSKMPDDDIHEMADRS
ncbi:MAG: hypothetical protein DME46_10405 [Verrucomicrobia bacterium]|nr:MAG: hypothetical protein DME46_10405 [Verrucomicrobiota bacterium]